MPLRVDTKDEQSNLAEYTRTGIEPKLTNITPGRLHHYRRLIFNTVKGSLSTAYPLARKLLTKDEWHGLVEDFFANFKSEEPQIWKMPVLLYEYVKATNHALKEKYPLLTDLLLFEWLEIEVFVMEDIELEEANTAGNWLTDIIMLNPHHKLNVLDWPVHKKKAADITTEDLKKYFLLTFRHPEKLTVNFHNLAPYHAFLVEQLAKQEYTLEEIVTAATEIFNNPFESLIQNATQFLTGMQEKGFIHGFISE